MGITIDGLITFCEEKEYNHRVSCKRNDDASGYTRSKDKNISITFKGDSGHDQPVYSKSLGK